MLILVKKMKKVMVFVISIANQLKDLNALNVKRIITYLREILLIKYALIQNLVVILLEGYGSMQIIIQNA